MPRIPVGAVIAAGAMLVGCHTITEELPTEPTETSKPAGTGVLTVSIPALSVESTSPEPTPTPTPTPSPEATPSPTPPPEEPAPSPEETGGCGAPLPPPIQRVAMKVHIRGPNKWTLDCTPLVAGADYCREIGFTDGRNRCPVRPEGHPERVACEAYAVGIAEDTGRTGPTWTRNGKYCDGSACDNHPDNQYLLWDYKGGLYRSCAQNGACGELDVVR